ncbi:winged helix-turn-helix domain-containing protein [Natrinema salsiterrestre]|uniref:Winged helix-turn-helix domain-containing protein n=1 Tax=Natrinema salsiterrestre TaxID=2950540 RepID=A0A9Q4KY75_9EURY|nr:winged helix-turn-helix domain-containing protein [Natrinema salsiterrestre]MDF9746003.1 winged helix-turn-helix domain-containing protein [Natrinema salsiterrestre]
MSTHASDMRSESTANPSAQLDVLGDDCARTILVATSDGPKTAKELTERTDSSSATVYRRINNLLESDLLAECVRFDDDGSHTTAYEATVDVLRVRIAADGIDVAVSDGEE